MRAVRPSGAAQCAGLPLWRNGGPSRRMPAGASPVRTGSGPVVRSVIAAALGGAAVVLGFLWMNRPAPEPAPERPVAAAARRAGRGLAASRRDPRGPGVRARAATSCTALHRNRFRPHRCVAAPASLEEVVARALPAVVLVETRRRPGQRLLRRARHAADQRARRRQQQRRHDQAARRPDLHRPRRSARAPVRSGRAQGEPAPTPNQPFLTLASAIKPAPGPGSDRDWFRPRDPAEHGDAWHRQRLARERRGDARADRRRRQPRQQRRPAAQPRRSGDWHHDDGLSGSAGAQLCGSGRSCQGAARSDPASPAAFSRPGGATTAVQGLLAGSANLRRSGHARRAHGRIRTRLPRPRGARRTSTTTGRAFEHRATAARCPAGSIASGSCCTSRRGCRRRGPGLHGVLLRPPSECLRCARRSAEG